MKKKKIAIIGTPSSGKTTLANKLSKIFNISVYHLDKIFWKDNGIHLSQTEFIEQVEKITKEPYWIIEGSMPRSKTLDIRIENADIIIFYDIPLLIILWRQTKRFFKYYNQTRPDMGGNNKQKWPFTWKEVKYAFNYPTKEIYSKIQPYTNNKEIIIIKNIKDEINFLQTVNSLIEKNL